MHLHIKMIKETGIYQFEIHIFKIPAYVCVCVCVCVCSVEYYLWVKLQFLAIISNYCFCWQLLKSTIDESLDRNRSHNPTRLPRVVACVCRLWRGRGCKPLLEAIINSLNDTNLQLPCKMLDT